MTGSDRARRTAGDDDGPLGRGAAGPGETGGTARGRALLALLVAVAAPLLAACGDDGAAPAARERETISREVFVETYVDLRLTALRSGREQVDPAAREEVLARQGVTEDDLLTFVEVHGERVHFMNGVWDEIEARIDSVRSAGDTVRS